jgi:hypothetical protein
MTDLQAPPAVDRLQKGAIAAGGVGLLLCALGWFTNAGQFYKSWLFAFLFWIGLAIGCMSITLIHNLTGGMWGLVIRRLLEAGARTLPWFALIFVPIAIGLPHIYVWAQPDAVAKDALLQHKALYLNAPFFLARAVFFFVVWFVLGHFQTKWARELDEGRNYLKSSRRLRGLGGAGLLLMGLTITFSAVDWAMSLNPHWFSTVYGVLFMVGQALSAMAFIIVCLALLGGVPPLSRVLGKEQVHDLGKLMLAFVMLWAYISFTQFLIIWSGNLPEEVPFYIQRLHGGWQYLALALVLFHFVLPFAVLLSRDLKRNARTLALVAGLVLAVRVVDLYWLIGPDLAGHHGPLQGSGLQPHWLDLAALLAIGGLWVFLFGRELRSRPVLPAGEPEIKALLEAHAS